METSNDLVEEEDITTPSWPVASIESKPGNHSEAATQEVNIYSWFHEMYQKSNILHLKGPKNGQRVIQSWVMLEISQYLMP